MEFGIGKKRPIKQKLTGEQKIERDWNAERNINKMWEKVAKGIKEVYQKVCKHRHKRCRR